MNKMRKLLGLLLVAAMAVSMLAVPASAEEAAVVNVGSFAELKEAVAVSDSIKLTSNITTEEALILSGKTITIDLDGHTLTLGAGDNKFKDATNLTIENGTLSIDGLVAKGNAIICLDEYGTEVTTLTLNDVHVEGKDYSSAYGVFYVGKTSVLNVNGGTMTLETELFDAGGVFKADASTSKLNIDDAILNLTNPCRGVTAMDTVITNSTVNLIATTTAGMEHGFNNCTNLTITDSNVTVSGGSGRGITLGRGNASTVTINGNSLVKISNMGEGAVVFHSASGAGSVLNIADTAVVLLDEEIQNTVSGTVNTADTSGLCTAHAMTEVAFKDSTCTATGNIAHYVCEACGRLYSDANGAQELTAEDILVKLKEHTYGTGVQTTAPTCEKTGVMTYTCTANGCGHTKTDTIDAAGHKLAPVAAKAATYAATGNTAHYACSACTKLFADAEGKTETTLEKVTIPQLIKVEEEKAEIKEEAVDTAISEAVSAGTAGDVVLDLNEVATDSAAENETPAAVTSAELPVASLEKVASISEEATLTVSMADATVVVDAAAMEAVAEQAEGTTVTLKVEQIEAETLTQTQQSAVASQKVVAAITASFVCSEGKEIHDFQGGSVTVAMPFTPEEGTEGADYQVLYIADDGSIEEIATTYANGTLIFTLEHFSEYVVVNTAEKNVPTNGSPATGDVGILSCAAAMLLSGAGMTAILPKKREEI